MRMRLVVRALSWSFPHLWRGEGRGLRTPTGPSRALPRTFLFRESRNSYLLLTLVAACGQGATYPELAALSGL